MVAIAEQVGVLGAKLTGKRRPLAVFDIDGTVFRSSLLIALVERLIAQGIFPPETPDEYEKQHHDWLKRRGDYDDYINALVDAFMRHIKGVLYADFARIAERVVDEEQHHLYRYTRDRIVELKRNGYFLLAVSQSPKTVLEGFCKNIGFDKVYGRIYELGPSDRFTGNVVDQHLIENKANIIKRALEREQVTLDGSVGVGDTEGDISFLELVETPICFNPNQKLYKHAKRAGWQVVVERKDVIYQL